MDSVVLRLQLKGLRGSVGEVKEAGSRAGMSVGGPATNGEGPSQVTGG